ncbi:pEARLI1-like lipid transfer protein [Thalictrum thalictroides]|uniref:PEARLI1-like lipid transfer protein n=1 Tax=Thalictrum thalictroides TaxID=46969 RepID=A0A7J6WTH0_THATH|nr:pEARLI1-like lipid transfer protein [Thalictrum thalictroides]
MDSKNSFSSSVLMFLILNILLLAITNVGASCDDDHIKHTTHTPKLPSTPKYPTPSTPKPSIPTPLTPEYPIPSTPKPYIPTPPTPEYPTPSTPKPSIPNPLTPEYPTPSTPKPHTPKTPKYPTPILPKYPAPYNPKPNVPKYGTCPRDALKLGVCAKLLGGLVGAKVGSPPNTPCCTLIKGLVDLEAAVCLCTAIKANVLNIIHLDVGVSISLLLNTCGKTPPTGFICA